MHDDAAVSPAAERLLRDLLRSWELADSGSAGAAAKILQELGAAGSPMLSRHAAVMGSHLLSQVAHVDPAAFESLRNQILPPRALPLLAHQLLAAGRLVLALDTARLVSNDHERARVLNSLASCAYGYQLALVGRVAHSEDVTAAAQAALATGDGAIIGLVAGAMARLGDVRAARALAEQIGSVGYSAPSFELIARAQIDLGQIQAGIASASAIELEPERSRALRYGALAQARSGDDSGAQRTVDSIQIAWQRSPAQLELDEIRARRLYDEAIGRARTGDLDGALSRASDIADRDRQRWLLVGLAIWQARRRAFRVATTIASRISWSSLRAWTLATIARLQARAGDPTAATTVRDARAALARATRLPTPADVPAAEIVDIVDDAERLLHPGTADRLQTSEPPPGGLPPELESVPSLLMLRIQAPTGAPDHCSREWFSTDLEGDLRPTTLTVIIESFMSRYLRHDVALDGSLPDVPVRTFFGPSEWHESGREPIGKRVSPGVAIRSIGSPPSDGAAAAWWCLAELAQSSLLTHDQADFALRKAFDVARESITTQWGEQRYALLEILSRRVRFLGLDSAFLYIEPSLSSDGELIRAALAGVVASGGVEPGAARAAVVAWLDRRS